MDSGTGKPRRPPIENIPSEITLIVAKYLSVHDLWRIMMVSSILVLVHDRSSHEVQTSRSMNYVYSNRLIWTEAMRDIISVKPMPRLSDVLPDISTETLIETVIRIARQDLTFSRSAIKLQEISRISTDNIDYAHLVFLPGGRHFICTDGTNSQIFCYSVTAKDTSSGDIVWPNHNPVSLSHIVKIRVTQYSVDIILLAVLVAVSYALGFSGFARTIDIYFWFIGRVPLTSRMW